nr:MAG: replication associated protein [Cressdnaviricota sp.]
MSVLAVSSEQQVRGNTRPAPAHDSPFVEATKNDQKRNWCLTWNHPGGKTYEEGLFEYHMPDLIDKKRIKYMVWQNEVGEKGTPHWQIYVEMKTKCRFGTIKALFPGTHIEWRKGTQAQARAYCMKEESRVAGEDQGPWEWGEFEADKHGARTDIEQALATLHETKDIKAVARGHGVTYVKYYRGIERIQNVLKLYDDKTWRTKLHILWGVPNSGKSYEARHMVPDSTYVLEAPNQVKGGVWWDAYTGEDVIVIEEFDKMPFLSIRELLTLADEGAKQIQYKGGFTRFMAKHIVITSNANWECWWAGEIITDTTREALKSRITRIKEFKYPHPDSTRTATVYETQEDPTVHEISDSDDDVPEEEMSPISRCRHLNKQPNL